MPKLKNDGFPTCVYFEHGQFYYKKKNIRTPLGRTPAEMYENYERLIGGGDKTVAALVQQYKNQVIYGGENPHSPDWAKIQERILKHILAGIGHRLVKDVDSKDMKALIKAIGEFDEKTGKYKRLVYANHAKSILRSMWNWAIEWEYREPGDNPAAQAFSVKKLPKPKPKSLKEEAVKAFWPVFNHVGNRMKIAMLFFRGTGMRSGDLRLKKISDIDDKGTKNEQHKRKPDAPVVRQFFQHNAYTLMAMDISKKVRVRFGSMYLIPKFRFRDKPYGPRSFLKMWKREMQKCVDAGIITADQVFTPHIVRKMAGTDQRSAKKASELLGNTEAVAGSHYFFGYEEIINEAAPSNVSDLMKYVKAK